MKHDFPMHETDKNENTVDSYNALGRVIRNKVYDQNSYLRVDL